MNKYFIIFFALCCVLSFSQERRITRDANASFFNKEDSLNIDVAIEKYNEAIELNNDFNTAKFNLANSLYNEEEYEESINLLEDIISNESNNIKKANAYYNKGKNEVSLYEKSNKEDIEFLESATNSFRDALKNNPNDNDTRFNLEKCLSILNELENQNDQDQESQDSEDQEDKDKENKDSEDQKDKDKENKDSEDQKDKDKENQDSEDQEDKDKENQDSEDQEDKDKENQDSEDQKDKDKEEQDSEDQKDKENQRDSKSGSTDGEDGKKKEQEIKASQINQILKAVENKEKEVQGKVKNVNGLEIVPSIKKTEKDW